MDRIFEMCWIAAPADCGKLTWDFPLWEVLATLLVSAAVTYVTVRVSMFQARAATETALLDSRVRELRAVIADLSTGADEVFRSDPDDDLARLPGRSRAVTADSLLRTSGLPFANDVALWVDTATRYALQLRRTGAGSGIPERPIENMIIAESGPAALISKRLAEYLVNPEKVGLKLKEEEDALSGFLADVFKFLFLKEVKSRATKAAPTEPRSRAELIRRIRSARRSAR